LLFAEIVEIFLQIIHNVISDDLVKEVREMATTTFDKNIVLDEAAAKKLAELLAQRQNHSKGKKNKKLSKANKQGANL